MSQGKHGLGPHGWPMYNLKATCYGLKKWILTLGHELGHESHPCYIKPSFNYQMISYSHANDFLCMSYVVD